MQSLVLVPGLLCDERLWSHQIRYLAEVAHCVVPDVSTADSIIGLAESVLAQAPPTFALAGLSMGGIIAHAIMALAPERVERLALISTTARADTPEQTGRRQRLIEMTEQGRFAEVTPLLLPALLQSTRQDDATLTTPLLSMATRIGPATFLRHVHAIIGRPDRRAQLAAYAVPTLVLVGREDAVTTLEMHEEMAQEIPHARLAIIEECGHISTLERPHAVTALMRLWLTG